MNTHKIVVAAVAFATFGSASLLGAGVAGATPSPTPNDLTGAANMVNDHAQYGMGVAMVKDTETSNGNDGMYCAVWITNDAVAPSDCR